jgi:membrane protein required for colicin V production
MNGIDLAIGAILIFSIIIGLTRGFAREFLSLFSWMTSGFLTYLTYPIVHAFLKNKIQNPMLADISSVISTFAFFLLLFGLFSHVLSNWIQNSGLGGLDRSLGILFGVLRGVMIICVFEIIGNCFMSRGSYPKSCLIPYITNLSDSFLDLLPAHIKTFLLESRKNGVTLNSVGEAVDRLSQLDTKKTLEKDSISKESSKKIDRLLTQTKEDNTNIEDTEKEKKDLKENDDTDALENLLNKEQ